MTATIARDRIRRSTRGVEGAWIREIRARSVARTATTATPSPGPKTRRREAAAGVRTAAPASCAA